MLKQNTIFDTKKSLLQELNSKEFKQKGIRVFVKRDDLIHPVVSGNKWRKLKFNCAQTLQNKSEGIMTFGGAFSNHLLATAFACKEIGLKSIGFVRGEELNENSNANLQECVSLGMKLVFLDRLNYGMRADFEYLKELKMDFPNFFAIPEGGANFYGMIGCQEVIKEIDVEIDHLFVAQGTCTTSCGILTSLHSNTKLHVVPVLKGFDAENEMKNLLNLITFDQEISEEYLKKVVVHDEYHFGGYAKCDDKLIDFIKKIKMQFDLPLDHVYTAKSFYAMMNWIEKTDFKKGENIVFLHTGGLKNSIFHELS